MLPGAQLPRLLPQAFFEKAISNKQTTHHVVGVIHPSSSQSIIHLNVWLAKFSELQANFLLKYSGDFNAR